MGNSFHVRHGFIITTIGLLVLLISGQDALILRGTLSIRSASRRGLTGFQTCTMLSSEVLATRVGSKGFQLMSVTREQWPPERKKRLTLRRTQWAHTMDEDHLRGSIHVAAVLNFLPYSGEVPYCDSTIEALVVMVMASRVVNITSRHDQVVSGGVPLYVQYVLLMAML